MHLISQESQRLGVVRSWNYCMSRATAHDQSLTFARLVYRYSATYVCLTVFVGCANHIACAALSRDRASPDLTPRPSASQHGQARTWGTRADVRAAHRLGDENPAEGDDSRSAA